MFDMKDKKRPGNPVILIVILILVLVFIISGLQFLESTVFHPTGTTLGNDTKTIVRDGVEYFPRQDITVIMVAGIDEYGQVSASDSYNNSGEADMISLMIFDDQSKSIHMLSLNRDTMMDIPVLGIGGKQAGTIFGQLALAHTYGSGLEDSAINLRNTVSDFLYGVHIDYYVTMNMDAIALLNDAVGGVQVTVTDDFSEIDPTITMGKVTLKGEQAVTFVRTRQGLGDQLNLTRMERQKEYMASFIDALKASKESSSSFVVKTYDTVDEYMVTDCPVKAMTSFADRYAEYTLGDMVSIQGENVKGEQYMEYHVDEEKLDQVILKYLYAPKV